jgi:lipopolysaccharide transport system permease protein
MSDKQDELPVTVIEPAGPWRMIDFKELLYYSDLYYFMVWASIKVAYAQSVGGFAWAIIRPALQILVFSLIFGGLVGLETDGIPYPLYSTVVVIPWSYVSGAMSSASSALLSQVNILKKVYIPRILFVMVPITSCLVDFVVSLVLIVVVALFYQVEPTWNLLLLPVVVLMMVMVPFAFGLWISSLAIRYRDVRIAMSYIMRVLMYTAPIVYSSSEVPLDMRWWYVLNPIVGVIEGFRACLLGGAIYWDSLISGLVVSFVLMITGSIYFRRMERILVDVV